MQDHARMHISFVKECCVCCFLGGMGERVCISGHECSESVLKPSLQRVRPVAAA